MGGALVVVGGAGVAGGFSRDGPDARPVGDCGNLVGLGGILLSIPGAEKGSVRACVQNSQVLPALRCLRFAIGRTRSAPIAAVDKGTSVRR